jgi:hypothetical protein
MWPHSPIFAQWSGPPRMLPGVGSYDVRVTIPGDAAWCIELAAEIRGRQSELGAEASVLPSSEATRLSATEPVLVLVWPDVTAESGLAAVAAVAGIASALLPDVYSSPYVQVASAVVDPAA